MARRRDKPTVTPSLTGGQELARRVLLGLVTALIVARPLVATEDPGLRELLPDASGMVLSWLWLVALLGWVTWRFWTKRDEARFGLLDGMLLALVGLNTLSTMLAARYRYAAWLGTWEWLTFFIAFYVVRRLGSWPGVGDGLLAALLATAVTLAAYAVFQYAYEIPENARKSRAQIQADWAAQGEFLSSDDPRLDQFAERARSPNVFATFGHPNSFAGFLGLLLPAALGWTMAGRRAFGWSWQAVLLAFCTALMLLALWWTHSRGAVVAVLLVAGIGAFWLARHLIALRHLRALLGLAALGLAIVLLAYFGLREKSAGKAAPKESFALRLGYWKATGKMIQEQPWVGVGPGNFGRHYTAYMSPTDFEEVQNPHNFALELWATCGFFGMAALLVGLGVFFRRAMRSISSLPLPPPLPSPGLAQTGQGRGQGRGQGTPWEFYLGGMAGLILSFALQAWHQSTDEIILGGTIAGIRSLVWFPAFALFMSVRWSGPSRALALLGGVAVLLVNLCVSDGISVPAVAIPLWIIIALVVATWDTQTGARTSAVGQRGQFAFLRRLVPIPVCAILVIVYYGIVLQPTALGAALARQSLKAQTYLRHSMEPHLAEQVPPDWERAIRRNRVGFVRQQILRPLELASQANPGDTRYLQSLALWTGVVWQMTERKEDRDAATSYAEQAEVLDPLNREGWISESSLRALFGRRLQLQSWNPTLAVLTPWGPFPNLQLPPQPLGALVRIFNEPSRTRAAKSARAEFEQSSRKLQEAVNLGSTQTGLRFELIMALQAAGKKGEATRQARQLRDLDKQITHRSRKLTPYQRDQVQRLLKGS